MDDNIETMMAEIKTVVSHHLVNVNDEFKDTMDVLNTLPLVVHLKQLVNKLSIENAQLKKLLKKYNSVKNIELEIVEMGPTQSLVKSMSPLHFFNFPSENSDDDDEEDDGN